MSYILKVVCMYVHLAYHLTLQVPIRFWCVQQLGLAQCEDALKNLWGGPDR